jgi:DNA-binding GntR family transcriptional regulator
MSSRDPKEQSVTPETIASQIAQAIREKVLAPGTPLIQEDLAKRFNVSRNPVREALRLLSADGLVTITQGSGATVRQLSLVELNELYDLRIVLEPQIADRIVDEATKRAVAELTSLADAMDSTEDATTWMRANFRFHSLLYEIAARPHTEAILRSLLSAVQPYSHENVIRLGGRSRASEEHHLMIEAIVGRESSRLAELFASHLSNARERLQQTFSDAQASAYTAF